MQYRHKKENKQWMQGNKIFLFKQYFISYWIYDSYNNFAWLEPHSHIITETQKHLCIMNYFIKVVILFEDHANQPTSKQTLLSFFHFM